MDETENSVGNATTGLSSLLGSLTGLATTGAQVYGAVTGKAPAPQKTAVQTATSSNTLYYIGGVVVLLLAGFLFMRRGR